MVNFADYFVYDETSPSCLRWKFRKSGTVPPSLEAGTINFASQGRNNHYYRVKLSGKLYLAHRIIYELNYGKVPDGLVVDHINSNSLDNRICNLQAITSKQNSMKMKTTLKNERNRSGAVGVFFSNYDFGWGCKIGNLQRVFRISTYGHELSYEMACLRRAEYSLNLYYTQDF